MALTDYAQKRQERVFARSQAVVGKFTMPTARDAIKIRGGATMPATGSDFVPSEEVRDTPDTDQFLKRKKPPAAFTLTTYAKVPTTPGVPPQWHELAKQSYGSGGFALTVGATFVGPVAVILDGVPVTIPAITDTGTATQRAAALATAVNGVTGLDATSAGAVCYLGTDLGAGELRIDTTTPVTGLTVGPVTYRFQTTPVDIVERLLTMIHYTDNAADYYRDCLVNNVAVRAEGTNEASLVFSGFLGNSTSASQTLLAGALGAHDGVTPVAFAVTDPAFQVGPTVDDVSWMVVDGEAFKVVDFDPNAMTGHAIGAQFGTTAATHASGAEVRPWIPGPDPDANDHIIGLTIGALTIDGTAYRIINTETRKDERVVARIDEAFEAALTGYKRTLDPRDVGGTILAYQRRAILGLTTWSEREKAGHAVLRLGNTTGPRLELDYPLFRLGRVDKGEQAGEFTRSFPFQGLASGTPGNDGVSMTVSAV